MLQQIKCIKAGNEDINNVFIGRQPIFDKDLKIYGYELLFRSGESNYANVLDNNLATNQVISNLLIDIGLDELIGNKLAFINMTGDVLDSKISRFLPPERVVLEILEYEKINQLLFKNIKTHVDSGYTIALDDFKYEPCWEPLLEIATIIKIDVFDKSTNDVKNEIQRLLPLKAKLLAEKVETQEEFLEYRKMGFEYFQGYFFSKPSVIKKAKLPDNQVALIRLLAELQNPNLSINEIEKLVSQTVTLNYKLFRYINSAYIGLPEKITSIHQAVVYFGIKNLRQLASMIAMTDVSQKPKELVVTGLIRAKMCELLAIEYNHPHPDEFFLTGLFSILDALLDHPIEKILQDLPLSLSVKSALIEKKGILGEALRCILAYEKCDWEDVKFLSLDTYIITKAYTDSVKWATETASFN